MRPKLLLSSSVPSFARSFLSPRFTADLGVLRKSFTQTSLIDQIKVRMSQYFCVRIGSQPGIFSTWAECKEKTIGVKGAEYKKCNSLSQAIDYMKSRFKDHIIHGWLAGLSQDSSEPSTSKRKSSTDQSSSRGVFYAVAKGFQPGIFSSWDEAKAQTIGFPGATHRKFPFKAQAEDWLRFHGVGDAIISGDTAEEPEIAPFPLPLASSPVNIANAVAIATASATPLLTNTDEPRISIKPSQIVSPIIIKTIAVVPPLSISPRNPVKAFPAYILSGLLGHEGVDHILTEDGRLVIHTDGAASSNGKRDARAGCGVWFGANHPFNFAEPLVGRQTNQRAEVLAVLRGLQIVEAWETLDPELVRRLPNIAKILNLKLEIRSDSQYTVFAMTRWITAWLRSNYKDGTVTNKDLFQTLVAVIRRRESHLGAGAIRFVHIRGHQGIHGNEEADKLARLGVDL